MTMKAVNTRVEVLEARIKRIGHCMLRDVSNKDSVSALTKELEAREAELKFMAFKAT